MKHIGDVCKINGAEIEPVDIITFGSPCQDLSVAGGRKGLSGERSGLFMEAVRIIKEMRNATKQLSMRGSDGHIRVYPSIAIWENVPGALSSGSPRGADFRCVLEELARIENPEVSIPMPKKWGGAGWIDLPHGCITWRVHDAQFWGVPQRRKRISLVVDFREEPKPEIQFISDSVSGNFETSEESGKTVARIIGEGVDSAISFQERAGKPGGVKESLSNPTTLEHCPPPTIKPLCIGNGQTAQLSESDKVGALNCMHDQQAIISPTNSEPILLESNQNHATIQTDGISTTLPASMGMGGGYVPMVVDEHHAVCVGVDAYNQATTGDKSKTLNSVRSDSDHVPCVCYGIDRASFNQGQNAKYDISIQEEIAQPIVARGPGGVMQTR